MRAEALDLVRHFEDQAADTPLGRIRFLQVLGVALFGLAFTLVMPKKAQAAPYPCYGYDQCACCSGPYCCLRSCFDGFFGCASQQQCWWTCTINGLYQCCDYGLTGGGNCICSYYAGGC